MNRYVFFIGLYTLVCLYTISIFGLSCVSWLIGFLSGMFFSTYIEVICLKHINKQEENV